MSKLRIKGGTVDDLREKRNLKPVDDTPYAKKQCVRCEEWHPVRQFAHISHTFGGSYRTRTQKLCHNCKQGKR